MLSLGDGVALASVCVVLATVVIKLAPTKTGNQRCAMNQLTECIEWQHHVTETVNDLKITIARLEERMDQMLETLARP